MMAFASWIRIPSRRGLALAVIFCLACVGPTSLIQVQAAEPPDDVQALESQSATESPPVQEAQREDDKHFCAVPPDLQAKTLPLRHTRAAHKAGKPLRIVALGTSSTSGGAAARGDSYPAQLEEELEKRLPGRSVMVINKGVGGQTARKMAERIEDDVLSLQPHLVIWQTGTVDTANNVDPEDFARALSQGIEMLVKEGTDVILMNMQYSRRLELIVNYEPYLEMMTAAAAQSDALLFDRLGMMRYWSESDQLKFENIPRGERAARASRLYHCIAWQLANLIEAAIH